MEIYTPKTVIDGWFDVAEHNVFSDWLYGPWDEDKYKMYLVLNEIPGVSKYMDYLLSRRRDEEYLNRHQMTYEDIHDPRRLSTSSTPMVSTLSWVSRNLDKLYR